MASTIVKYRKVINGVGYLFELPLRPPPPASGDKIDVRMTLFLKNPDKALYEPQLDWYSPRNHVEAGDAVTLDVSAAGTIWFLPLINPSGAKENQHLIVSARRMPAFQQGAAGAVPGASSSSMNGTGAASGRGGQRESAVLRAAQLYHDRPHPEDLLRDAESVRNIDAFLEAFDFTKDDLEGAESDEESSDEELRINYAYGNQITRMQYVEVLYKGDDPLYDVDGIDKRLANPLSWSVSKSTGTWYRRTRFGRAKRARDWKQLLADGLPCRVKNNHIDVLGRSIRIFGLKTSVTSLADGNARFRLVRIKDTYNFACQPAAASPHASQILNLYLIVVKEEDRDVCVYTPFAEPVDERWDLFLRDLAEQWSAETQGTLIFSEKPHRDKKADAAMGFGVRLRDGGARLNLHAINGNDKWMLMHLRGRRKWPERSALRSGWEWFGPGFTSVHICLPPSKQGRDIVLRVSEQADGDYRAVEYVVRARSLLTPVKEEEWQSLTTELVEDTTLLHILNAARVTFGRPILEELPSAQGSSAPKDKKPRLA